MGGKARPQIVRPGRGRGLRRGRLRASRRAARRPGAGRARERLPEGADEIVLGRRIGASGRTSAFVQGRSASAADLRALGSRLLAFYGQHEHRKLVLSSAQLEILDGFAGAEHLERRARYREAHAEVGAISRELAELREREGARERDLDLLRFELAEIEAAAPDPDEEGELARSATGCATRRGCAPPRRRRWRRSPGSRTTAERAAPSGEAEAALAAVEAIDPALDEWRSGAARPAWSSTTPRARCAPISRGSRPSRSGSSRWRSGCTSSIASSESTVARSRRCWSTPSGAGPRSSGWRMPTSAPPSSSAGWPTADGARGELAGELSEGAGQGRRSSSSAACGRARPRWRWRAPR